MEVKNTFNLFNMEMFFYFIYVHAVLSAISETILLKCGKHFDSVKRICIYIHDANGKVVL